MSVLIASMVFALLLAAVAVAAGWELLRLFWKLLLIIGWMMVGIVRGFALFYVGLGHRLTHGRRGC